MCTYTFICTYIIHIQIYKNRRQFKNRQVATTTIGSHRKTTVQQYGEPGRSVLRKIRVLRRARVDAPATEGPLAARQRPADGPTGRTSAVKLYIVARIIVGQQNGGQKQRRTIGVQHLQLHIHTYVVPMYTHAGTRRALFARYTHTVRSFVCSTYYIQLVQLYRNEREYRQGSRPVRPSVRPFVRPSNIVRVSCFRFVVCRNQQTPSIRLVRSVITDQRYLPINKQPDIYKQVHIHIVYTYVCVQVETEQTEQLIHIMHTPCESSF